MEPTIVNEDFVIVERKRSTFNRKYKINSTEFTCRFNEKSVVFFNSFDEWYLECFKNILLVAKEDARPHHLVGLSVSVEGLEKSAPIGIHYTRADQLSAEMIIDILNSVIQSNESFSDGARLRIGASILHTQIGGSRGIIAKTIRNLFDYTKKKKFLFTVPLRRLNDEQILKTKRNWIIDPHGIQNSRVDKYLCLPLCLALGIRLARGQTKSRRRLLDHLRIKGKRVDLKLKAHDIIRKAGIPPNICHGLVRSDLVKIAFSSVFKNKYTIHVYIDRLNPRNRLIPCKTNHDSTPIINLFLMTDAEHYILIVNLKRFFGLEYQCKYCKIPYSGLNHRCTNDCAFCRSPNACIRPPPPIKLVKCDDCNRFFQTIECYEQHKINTLAVHTDPYLADRTRHTVCNLLQVCKTCNVFVDYRRRISKRDFDSWPDKHKVAHECGEGFCRYCKKMYSDFKAHRCFIQKYSGTPPEHFIIYFYDIECIIDGNDTDETEPVSNTSKTYAHIPNLLITERVCNFCVREFSSSFICEFCEPRRMVFEGRSCVDEFLNTVFAFSWRYKKYKPKVCLLAHNSGRYDNQFIIQSLLERPNTPLKIIANGLKILKITAMHTFNFLDSLNYIPIALRAFSKAFDISEVVKGYYPFLFNLEKNYNYVGKIPDRRFFLPQSMKPDDYIKFDEWYNQVSNDPDYVFDNRKTLIEYCAAEVGVLRIGSLKFLLELLDMQNINVFFESITFASACFKIYTKHHMPENSMALVRPLNDTQSFIGRLWLLYEGKKWLPAQIQREYKLKEGPIVDGISVLRLLLSRL